MLKGIFSCSLMVVLSCCLFCISLHTGADTANMFGGGWSDEGEENHTKNTVGKPSTFSDSFFDFVCFVP